MSKFITVYEVKKVMFEWLKMGVVTGFIILE